MIIENDFTFPTIILDKSGNLLELGNALKQTSFPTVRRKNLEDKSVEISFTDIDFFKKTVRKIIDYYSKEGKFLKTVITEISLNKE